MSLVIVVIVTVEVSGMHVKLRLGKGIQFGGGGD